MKAKRNRSWSWLLLLGTALCTTIAAHADPIQLQAYTGVVAGSDECPAGGAPPALGFFSTDVGFGIGDIGNGISSCGLSGNLNNQINVGPGAPPTSSMTNLNNGTYLNAGSGLYTGAAGATANFGNLSVGANSALTGYRPANGVAESVAFAISSDTIDVNVPGGGSGYIVLQYTLNGGLSQSANDVAAGTLEVQVAVGSASERPFYGVITEDSAVVYSDIEGPVSGCTVGADNFNCVNATFDTTMLPIVFGAVTPYEVGLIVGTGLFGGPGSVDPSPGMLLTGIELFNANGTPIGDFSITSGSGAVYGANGLISEPASSVPEPSMGWLLATALPFVLGASRLRRRT